MMSSNPTPQESEDEDLLDANEAAEQIPANDEDSDDAMDSGSEDEGDGIEMEVQLQNDSIEHFDGHGDSIFCITRHPIEPCIVATGGGDDKAYVWNSSSPSTPLLASSGSFPHSGPGRASLIPIAKLEGHGDSVNCITYTLPSGAYLMTGGLDGKLRAHTSSTSPTTTTSYPLLAETQEVPEINWISPASHPSYPNTIALGASDGSVWVYTIDASDTASPLQVQQAYYLSTDSCTAGAWTPDGKLLATVSEGGQLFVWDPFGEAAGAGVTGSAGSPAVISLGMEDQRFAVEGGLYCVAIAPSGAFAVVGGAGGMIRVIGLPRLGVTADGANATQSMKGGGAKNKIGGGKAAATTSAGPAAGQAGQMLASLQAQSDGIETLAFAPAPSPLMAAGSVDGSIAIFDTAHRFAVRRHIKEATEDGFAVVKIEFGRGEIGKEDGGHLLTSCGMDGVVRRWDTRGGTTAGGHGLVGQWRGHRGEGEGGGVMDFVCFGASEAGGKGRIVTAGDDGVALVFAT